MNPKFSQPSTMSDGALGVGWSGFLLVPLPLPAFPFPVDLVMSPGDVLTRPQPQQRVGGLTLFSWLGMMQRTKLGVVLRSVVISFPSCSLYSCPTVRNMPFLVLEALGSELSVILAIWSSPTIRSTGGHVKGGISLWPTQGPRSSLCCQCLPSSTRGGDCFPTIIYLGNLRAPK